MASVCKLMSLCCWLLGFGARSLAGTCLVAADRRFLASQPQNLSSGSPGHESTCWLWLLLVVCLFSGWRQCRSACDATLVLFVIPLSFSFCSLLLFMPLVRLAALLVADIRFCWNWCISIAPPDRPRPTPKVWPSKEEKRLHRRMQKQLRKLIRCAKQDVSKKRAAIGAAACWILDSVVVSAVIVSAMMPFVEAIMALGLVDILLHIIATAVILGSS